MKSFYLGLFVALLVESSLSYNFLSALTLNDDCHEILHEEINQNCKSLLRTGLLTLTHKDDIVKLYKNKIEDVSAEELNLNIQFYKFRNDVIINAHFSLNQNEMMTLKDYIPYKMHYIWLNDYEIPYTFQNNIINNHYLMGGDWSTYLWVKDPEKVKVSNENLVNNLGKRVYFLKDIDDLVLMPNARALIEHYLEKGETLVPINIAKLYILYHIGGNYLDPFIRYNNFLMNNYHTVYHSIGVYEKNYLEDYYMSTYPNNPYVKDMIYSIEETKELRDYLFTESTTDLSIIRSIITANWLNMLIHHSETFAHNTIQLSEIRFFRKNY